MPDLVKMTRPDGAIAYVRPEWVSDWRERGWQTEGDAASPRRGRPRKVDG